MLRNDYLYRVTLDKDSIIKRKPSNPLLTKYEIGKALFEFIEFDFIYIEKLIDDYIKKYFLETEKLISPTQDTQKSNLFIYILTKLNSITYLNLWDGEFLADLIFRYFIILSIHKYKDKFEEFKKNTNYNEPNEIDYKYLEQAYNSFFDFLPSLNINTLKEYYLLYKERSPLYK